jgi:hypothetical protein
VGFARARNPVITFSGVRIEPSTKFGGKYDGVPTLVDIAVGLGRMPRFAGQTRRWWSGILHSFVTHEICRLEGGTSRDQLLCLLHDAHEAVTGDIPAFFKTKDMSVFQAEIDERLYTAYGLWPISEVEHDIVKACDDAALRAEAAVLGPANIMSHLSDPAQAHVQIVQEICMRFPNASDTDGIDCKASQWFYNLFARHIGGAVHNRNDDTPSNQKDTTPTAEVRCLKAG